MRIADMRAIEDLERAADEGLGGPILPGVPARTGEGPMETYDNEHPALVMNERLRQLTIRMSHIMDLVSVLCMRANVTADEVADAHRANTQATGKAASE